jgi:hypothetical protein
MASGTGSMFVQAKTARKAVFSGRWSFPRQSLSPMVLPMILQDIEFKDMKNLMINVL